MLEAMLNATLPATQYTYTDILPAMTGNATPTGYRASASSTYSVLFPYYPFSKRPVTDSVSWTASKIVSATDIIAEWLMIEIPTAIIVKKYDISGRSGGLVDHQLQGSNNGTTFTVLSTVTDVPLTTATNVKEVEIDNKEAYRYYRIFITRSSGGYPSIHRLYLYSGVEK